MTVPARRGSRPQWMSHFGDEGFGDIFSDRLWGEWHRDFGAEWNPSMDIFEKDDKYFLKAEAPGLNKDDFKITLREGVLTVSGKKEHNREEKGTNYYLRETGFGEFSRSFRLPGEIEEDKIEAHYRDGVLTLEMPRKMPERKQVTIN